MDLPRSYLDPKVLARLASYALESRMPMIGSVTGRHASPMRGSSLEFAQYRKYVPGDDTRRLDWRVWGRSDRSYIKEYEADTNLRMCFVMDASGSMNYGRKENGPFGKSKLDRAKAIAGSLAWLAVKQGDAVGLSTAHVTRAKDIPARRGTRHLKILLEQLDRLEADGECDLAARLHVVAERCPRRGLVVIVSDLFLDLDGLKHALKHLRHRKHDIAIFHLLDAEEVSLPYSQPMQFLDLEGGSPLLADPVAILSNYESVVSEYMQQLQQIVSKLEIDYRRVDSDSSLVDSLAKFLSTRVSRRNRS
jgi:uncharacterized protein (DUF58 family)